MREFLLRIIFNTFSIYLAGKVIEGVQVPTWKIAFTAAIALGVLNMTIKPILELISMPITVISLGIFSFVINAIVLLIATSYAKIVIPNATAAIMTTLLIVVCNWILGVIFNVDKS